MFGFVSSTTLDLVRKRILFQWSWIKYQREKGRIAIEILFKFEANSRQMAHFDVAPKLTVFVFWKKWFTKKYWRNGKIYQNCETHKKNIFERRKRMRQNNVSSVQCALPPVRDFNRNLWSLKSIRNS